MSTTTPPSPIATPEPTRRDTTSHILGIDEHAGAAHRDMPRLDDPCQIALMGDGVAETQTLEAWVGHRLAGRAAVARQQLAGPPLRGVYRIHGVAAHDRSDGVSVIERAIEYAAARGGRLLWCHALLDAVDVWRQRGFTISGPPVTAQGGGVRVLMTRRLTSTDAVS